MAIMGAMGARLASEQRNDRGGVSLASHDLNTHELTNSKGINPQAKPGVPSPMEAAGSRAWLFADPHTARHGRRELDQALSCSTEDSVETQGPVAAAPAAETLTTDEYSDVATESSVMTDCVTSGASSSVTSSVSESTDLPQSSGIPASNQTSESSPCPDSIQSSGPTLAPETPEARTEFESHTEEGNPAPTEGFTFPGQVMPTSVSCEPAVSSSIASGPANRTIFTTVIIQPVEAPPSATAPIDSGAATAAQPEATETSHAQTSPGSRIWSVGILVDVLAIGLLGRWLLV